jgi:hypothetical protein
VTRVISSKKKWGPPSGIDGSPYTAREIFFGEISQSVSLALRPRAVQSVTAIASALVASYAQQIELADQLAKVIAPSRGIA